MVKILIPIIIFLVILATGTWWLKISNEKPATGFIIFFVVDVIVILLVLIIRPFVFGSQDFNNILIYFIYLITIGGLFSSALLAFKDDIYKKGIMPKAFKKILFSYLTLSVLILTLITMESLSLD